MCQACPFPTGRDEEGSRELTSGGLGRNRSLRLANKGYTPLEATEVIELPKELGRKWFNRGYHGTLHHDCAPSTPRNLPDDFSITPARTGRVP
jgi:hypothetical protein